MEVGFHNALVTGGGVNQVELQTFYADSSLFIDSYSNEAGINVHVFDGALRGITPTGDSYGRFRVTRSGNTITGLFDGTPIYSTSNSAAHPLR